MTRFFIPELDLDHDAEIAYRALRDSAEARTGAVSQDRRIFGIMCRRNGTDCTINVGDPDGDGGATILAILEVSGGLFTIHRASTVDADDAPVVLPRHSVYSVIEFARPPARQTTRRP